MFDNSFCCLRSLILVQKIRIDFQKVSWMPESLLASERSERDTMRGVQILAGEVYIYIKNVKN